MGTTINESRAVSLMKLYLKENFPTLLVPFRIVYDYGRNFFCDKKSIVWITESYIDVPSGAKYKVNNRLESMYDLFGEELFEMFFLEVHGICLLYTSPSPRDLSTSRMPSSA